MNSHNPSLFLRVLSRPEESWAELILAESASAEYLDFLPFHENHRMRMS